MTGDVGAWEPGAALGDAHAKALDRAAASASATTLAVDDADAHRLREVVNATTDERQRLFQEHPSKRLIDWLRVLTLAESEIPGCDAGAKSPVIDLANLLRGRGDYPPPLTAWIKSVNNNRFLPYGSLADRLRR